MNFHLGYGVDTGKRIVHAHDKDQLSDIHWPIGVKDLGTIDWDNEIQYLKDIKFDGVREYVTLVDIFKSIKV